MPLAKLPPIYNLQELKACLGGGAVEQAESDGMQLLVSSNIKVLLDLVSIAEGQGSIGINTPVISP